MFTWRFISAAFQNDPIFWWICVGISFGVVSAYFITRNYFCQNDRNEFTPRNVFQTHIRIKHNSQRVCLFILLRVNFVHMKISCRFEISIRSRRLIWNPCLFEFHFASNHVNTRKELTEHQIDFQLKWNLITV